MLVVHLGETACPFNVSFVVLFACFPDFQRRDRQTQCWEWHVRITANKRDDKEQGRGIK